MDQWSRWPDYWGWRNSCACHSDWCVSFFFHTKYFVFNVSFVIGGISLFAIRDLVWLVSQAIIVAAESVCGWYGFLYSKVKCCFLRSLWQCPRPNVVDLTVEHFRLVALERMPFLSVAISCLVWLNVPQMVLVSVQGSNTNIVLLAVVQKLVLNGLIVKSAAYSRACRTLLFSLQLATVVWECTTGSFVMLARRCWRFSWHWVQLESQSS